MASSYNGQTPKLKYLFTATFADGKVIKQTSEDQSLLAKERSAFYDVLEYEKKSTLVKFSLQEVGPFKLVNHLVEVDLLTGLFTVNGLVVDAAEQNFEPTNPLKIVYFRESRIEQEVEQKTGKLISERAYVSKFFVGWQTLWKNKNFQRTVALNGS